MSRSTASSTQEHLPIAGIQDGVVIMNDGSVRAIVKVEPINFELKSETEQNAIIYSYQGFLNSLEFPIQIVIHSKKLDLERYLLRLEEQKKQSVSDLLRIQTEDYIEFVRRLISVANIMAKRFFVVVSYAAVSKPSGLAAFGSILSHKPSGPLMDQDQFGRYQAEVLNRANLVGNGLSRLGLKISVMETQQLIELFYGIYNPDIAAEERLTNIGDISAGVVSSPQVNAFEAGEPAPEPAPPVPEPQLDEPPLIAQPPPPPAPVETFAENPALELPPDQEQPPEAPPA